LEANASEEVGRYDEIHFDSAVVKLTYPRRLRLVQRRHRIGAGWNSLICLRSFPLLIASRGARQSKREEVKAMMKYISIPLLLSLIAIAGCHVAAGVG
jgi:hypothetical protein